MRLRDMRVTTALWILSFMFAAFGVYAHYRAQTLVVPVPAAVPADPPVDCTGVARGRILLGVCLGSEWRREPLLDPRPQCGLKAQPPRDAETVADLLVRGPGDTFIAGLPRRARVKVIDFWDTPVLPDEQTKTFRELGLGDPYWRTVEVEFPAAQLLRCLVSRIPAEQASSHR